MNDYVQKVATTDANQNKGARDVSREPSQTQERYNATYNLAKSK